MSNPLTLADIIAALSGKPLPTPAKVKAAPAKKAAPPILPMDKQFALQHTGYINWTATGFIIQTTVQVCACCGHEQEVVSGQFYRLENGQAHAAWLRHEGYGIIEPEDLPIEYVSTDPVSVRACPSCRWVHRDLEIALCNCNKQLNLSL